MVLNYHVLGSVCSSIFSIVNVLITLLAAIALASVVSAQTPPAPDLATSSLSLEPAQAWEIPALGYGPNEWSILRITNNSDSPASLQLDVYCGAGNRLPLDSTVAVPARNSRDVRIEAQTTTPVMCWARVNEISGVRGRAVQLRAFLETLKGNQLEDFDREPALASANASWAFLASEVAGEQLYILNASDKATVLTFCAANKPYAKECNRKGSNPVTRLAKPRQAVLLGVKTFHKKYLITQSSEPGRAILEVFNDKPGHRRVYTSESSISFDTPEN